MQLAQHTRIAALHSYMCSNPLMPSVLWQQTRLDLSVAPWKEVALDTLRKTASRQRLLASCMSERKSVYGGKEMPDSDSEDNTW